MDNDYGYGEVENVVKKTSSGKYLTLEDGREYQLRIASEPKYVINHWVTVTGGKQNAITCVGKECSYCGDNVPSTERVDKTAQWGWIVIDREDGKVKMLKGPNKVALDLKTLSEIVNKKTGKKTWGDPRTFDITIKKEKQGNFTKYTIQPLPDDRGALSEIETQMVLDSGIDLAKELKGSKKSENLGNYGGKNQSLETAPEEDRAEVPADLGETPTAGAGHTEDVDEEDIPF